MTTAFYAKGPINEELSCSLDNQKLGPIQRQRMHRGNGVYRLGYKAFKARKLLMWFMLFHQPVIQLPPLSTPSLIQYR